LRRVIYENETFRMGKNVDLNACVGNNGFIDLYTYQCGYYEATIELINSIKKSWTKADLLIYPVVYSARHTIELFLKNQLFNLKYINSKAKGVKFESQLINTHEIKELWNQFKKLSAVDIRYEPYTKDLEEYISDFYQVDNTGETFRYPFSHEDVRHLTDLACINIDIFEKRFTQLYKMIDELGYLTDFLINEYKEGTVIKGLSRQQIKEIALELPARKDWGENVFAIKKAEILKKYNISSTTFSKVLSLIQRHKEFASYVGLEVPLSEINKDQLKAYIGLYHKYHQDVKKGDYLEIKNNYVDIICKELPPEVIQSLSALADIGYYHLYPEAYDRIIKEKADQDVFNIVFDDLLDRRIVLDKIKEVLQILGQRTLLQSFEYVA